MAKNPGSIDPSLWWDSFSLLFTELENVPLSSDFPPTLVTILPFFSRCVCAIAFSLSDQVLGFRLFQNKKVKENHGWFVDTVSRYKPPSAESREALNSPELKIGSHVLKIEPVLKEKALEVSPLLVSSILFCLNRHTRIFFSYHHTILCCNRMCIQSRTPGFSNLYVYH